MISARANPVSGHPTIRADSRHQKYILAVPDQILGYRTDILGHPPFNRILGHPPFNWIKPAEKQLDRMSALRPNAATTWTWGGSYDHRSDEAS